MQTQTHLLLASVALGRDKAPGEQSALLAGALLPDLSIFVLAAWAMLAGIDGATLWSVTYWAEPWQSASAVSNSVFVWGLIALAGRLTRRRWLCVLGLAALLHVAFDLPVHADDAHRHFWPVSDFRFASPVSYWDPAHHGRIVSVIEAAGGVALCVLLWRRHARRAVRALLVLLAAGYVAVPLFFALTLG